MKQKHIISTIVVHMHLWVSQKKCKALFMILGTIYMYYAHGSDFLNFSCLGNGNTVLVKSGFLASNDPTMLQKMRQLNPVAWGSYTDSQNLPKLHFQGEKKKLNLAKRLSYIS